MIGYTGGVPPSGMVAMLFTDIEGSTRLARRLREDWAGVLAAHRALVRAAIDEHAGYVEGTEGDSFFATFSDARAAVASAVAAQRAVRAYGWPAAVGELRVRMGLHVGTVEHVDGHYVGLEVHRAARISAAAAGGQVLLSAAARAALPVECPVEDLGVHRLKDFPEPLRLFHLRVHDDRGAAAFPAPRTLSVRPTNLPPARGLVGRDGELAAVATALSDGARLVCLTGLGGVGKTGLALSAAGAALDDHAGGVWLVRADRLTAARELLPALAAALHVRDVPDGDLGAAVAERLGEAPALLVLDNLEHLPGVAGAVEELLMALPAARVLATSRAPLRVAGEHRIAVEPLAADDATTLFAALARRAHGDVSPADAAAVDAICAALHGLPLALELAAARLRILTVRQLAERLGSAAGLSGGGPDRPARQRSLRATVDWTVGLLSPGAQRLFARLGVFVSPVSLELVEAVCGVGIDVVDAGAELLDFALLRRDERGLMLVAALRELAAERLREDGEEAAIRQAHADALIEAAREVGPPGAADRREHERVEAALHESWNAVDWAAREDTTRHGELVVRFLPYWIFTEGRLRAALEQSTRALAESGQRDAVTRGRLLLAHGHVLTVTGSAAEGRAAAEQAALLLAGQPAAEVAECQIVLSMLRDAAGAHTEAVTAARAAVASARQAGSRRALQRHVTMLAQCLIGVGDLAGAGAALDEAEALAVGLDTVMTAAIPNIRGDWALADGDPRRALACFTTSLATTLRESSRGLALWDAAGIVVALGGLDEPAATLEGAALLELEATAQGADTDTLRYLPPSITDTRATAHAALTDDVATDVIAQANARDANDRLPRLLNLGLTVSFTAAAPDTG